MKKSLKIYDNIGLNSVLNMSQNKKNLTILISIISSFIIGCIVGIIFFKFTIYAIIFGIIAIFIGFGILISLDFIELD